MLEQQVRVEACLVEQCLVEHYHYSPGRYGVIAPHAHAEWQIGLNPDLPSRYQWRGALHHVSVDRVSLFAPDERHGAFGEDMTGITRYFVLYVPESQKPARRLGEASLNSPVLYQSLQTFHGLMAEPATHFEREVQLALVLNRFDAPQGATHAAQPLGHIRDYLHDSLTENVRLTDLARLAGLTPEHLCRAFARAYGSPPHAYLLQLRVRRAKQLLIAGFTPETVAGQLGFYDYSHFARRFRRVVGVSPTHYGRINNVQDSIGS